MTETLSRNLTVQIGRPGGRGFVVDPDASETYVVRPVLDRIPAVDEIVDVVSILPILVRSGYGPPTVTGYRFVEVGSGNWVWKIVRSPWNYNRNDVPNRANLYGTDRFDWSFRVAAFDASTGEPVNRIFDVDADFVAGAETGTEFA